MYGAVVVFLMIQAMYILTLQYNKAVLKLYLASLILYLSGFLLWNIGKAGLGLLLHSGHYVIAENQHCPTVSRLRAREMQREQHVAVVVQQQRKQEVATKIQCLARGMKIGRHVAQQQMQEAVMLIQSQF